jgi:hypothetical protein
MRVFIYFVSMVGGERALATESLEAGIAAPEDASSALETPWLCSGLLGP